MSILRCRVSLFPWLPLAVVALAAGCNRGQPAVSAQAKATSPEKPAAVTTVKPVAKALHRVIEQPAHIEAFEETPLSARVSGYIKKVHVDIGDRVRGPRFDDKGKQTDPGQTLAEILVPEMEEELQQKKALVAQALAEVDQASAALDAAEANIATAKAWVLEAEAGRERAQANYDRWASEYARTKKLVGVLDESTLMEAERQVKSMAASQKEVEAKVHSAKAGVLESEAKRNRAKADVAAAKARVQVAQAEVARVAALLEYRNIRAPYDGVITSRNVHTGYYLTGTGIKPLFTVARTDVVRVLVDVPEADAAFIKDGVPATVRCQTLKDQVFEGKVTRSSWALDAKSRTLRAEVHLRNEGDKLRPGSYAYVTFVADLPTAYTLPAAVLTTQGDQSFCYLLDSGKAIRLPLKLGMRDGSVVQVLKKQTQPGVWQDMTGQEEVLSSDPTSLLQAR